MNGNNRSGWRTFVFIALAGAACSCTGQPAEAQVVRQIIYSVIYLNGWGPSSSLVQAPDGYFYGIMEGSRGGPVFRMTPAGVMTALRGVPGTGTDAEGGLVLATDGNLYGTTMAGGAFGLGTIFKVVPSQGYFQAIHSFDGSDAAQPAFNLIQASDGCLYGVSMRSGWISTNPPIVFRATLSGLVTVVAHFPAYTMPNDGLVEGPDGWLYGTTAMSGSSPSPIGSIYRVSPDGAYQTLAYFHDPPGTPILRDIGERPFGGLTAGADGFLYGTLGHGPSLLSTNKGSVFRMSPDGNITTFVRFDGTNGANPMTRLLLAKDGSFYGLTTEGGAVGYGTIFRVTTDGILTTLADGVMAGGISLGPPPLTEGQDGNFYGTGLVGRQQAVTNIIYRLVPRPMITAATWSGVKLTLTWNSFTNGAYRIAYKDAFGDATWITQFSTITATGRIASASDYPGIRSQRFYQVVLLP